MASTTYNFELTFKGGFTYDTDGDDYDPYYGDWTHGEKHDHIKTQCVATITCKESGTTPTYEIDIWTDVDPSSSRYEEGKRYSDYTEPATHHYFSFSSVENSDADFEIFRPHLTSLIKTFNLEKNVHDIHESHRRSTITLKSNMKKQKKHSKVTPISDTINSELDNYRRSLFLSAKGTSPLPFSVVERKAYHDIITTIVWAVVQLEFAEKVTMEKAECPHMSCRRKS